MLSSLNDGRYREQKMRLNGLLQQRELKSWFYILEGNSTFLNEKQKNTLNGVLISTQLRDNVQIIKTNNCYETYQFIIKLVSRLEKKPIFNNNNNIITTIDLDYNNTIKIKKKDNINANTVQKMAISNIPQCSMKISDAIITKYGSLMDLFDIYQGIETEKEKEQLLSNIQINENRKIGYKLSKKIYDYLFKV